MNIALIVLLGCILLLLIVLNSRINSLRINKYIRVFRPKDDFVMTKERFKQLGYEIADVKQLGDGFLMIIFVKVK